MSLHSGSHGRYLASLDGLRAVAILVVMGSHLISSRLIPGQFGVTLFFFISGFIITRNLLEDPPTASGLKWFYIRRFFRLMPAVAVYVAATWVVARAFSGGLPTQDMLASLFYFANYHRFSTSVVEGTRLSPLEMTWSLSVEEHFYLAFPLLILATGSARRLLTPLVTVVVCVLGWRSWLFLHGANEWDLYAHTDTRLDSLAYGCLLSAVFRWAKDEIAVERWLLSASTGRGALLGSTLLALSFVIRDENFRSTIRYFVQGIALMPIFCYLFFQPIARSNSVNVLLSTLPMIWIGRISYSLYLYHVLCWFTVLQFRLTHTATVMLTTASALLLAQFSYWMVEQPGRRFGMRLTLIGTRRDQRT